MPWLAMQILSRHLQKIWTKTSATLHKKNPSTMTLYAGLTSNEHDYNTMLGRFVLILHQLSLSSSLSLLRSLLPSISLTSRSPNQSTKHSSKTPNVSYLCLQYEQLTRADAELSPMSLDRATRIPLNNLLAALSEQQLARKHRQHPREQAVRFRSTVW